jgi:nitric oxide reductase NorQ protein
MSIATMIESMSSSILDNKRRQTLVFKADDDVVVFSRLTDGKQGPSNKWERRSFEEALGLFHDGEHLTRDVAGVEITISDIAKFAEGSIQVLGVKAVSALNKSNHIGETDTSALDVFVDMYEAVMNDNVDLNILAKMRKAEPQQTTTNIGDNVTHSIGKTISTQLASIPRKEISDRYVNRKLAGNLYDYEVFDHARSTHANVLIYGPTGPGKTTSVEAWCASRGLRLATISGNATLEPSHLFGKYVSDGEGGFAWIDGPVTDIARNGGGAIIFDELNFINMKVITPSYPMLDARRSITLLDHHGETIELHPDVTIFATMNPGYVGTSPLNFAFRNRFDIQIEWDYDYDVEAKLVKGKNILDMAKHLRTEAAKGMYDTPISTNMLMEFEELAKNLNYEFAAENFIAHFGDEEKASIRMILQTYEQNLRSDMGLDDMDIVLDTESV